MLLLLLCLTLPIKQSISEKMKKTIKIKIWKQLTIIQERKKRTDTRRKKVQCLFFFLVVVRAISNKRNSHTTHTTYIHTHYTLPATQYTTTRTHKKNSKATQIEVKFKPASWLTVGISGIGGEEGPCGAQQMQEELLWLEGRVNRGENSIWSSWVSGVAGGIHLSGEEGGAVVIEHGHVDLS